MLPAALVRHAASLATHLSFIGLRPLPLRIERMTTRAQFHEVAALRRAAYGQHYPRFVQPDQPDEWDASPSAIVLMARERASGQLCATLRMRHSLGGRAAGRFHLQGFPDWLFDQGSFVTVERFAVRRGPWAARRLARYALFSAVYAFGREAGITYVNGYTTDRLACIYRTIGMAEPAQNLVLCDALTNFVPQTLLQARTLEIPRRSRVPGSRLLLWRFNRCLARDQLAPAAARAAFAPG